MFVEDAAHTSVTQWGMTLMVEVTRGAEVESRHELDVVVVGLHGVRQSWGDADRGVLARSSLKPIQAVPLIESGAADAFALTQTQLAMSCASHNGEAGHVDVVEGWLQQLGRTGEDLECGTQTDTPDARHNNCSGKHCGFLTVCRHLGIDHRGYIGPDHPLQHDVITPMIEELCEMSTADQSPSIDGCGIPVWSIPLSGLATGWLGLTQRDAGQRLLAAMAAAPWFVAGTGRVCTRVMEAGGGRVMVKTGAEGVFAGVAPAEGIAWAIKARDGASRASEAALLWLINELGLDIGLEPDPLTNWAGTEVGEFRVHPS